MSVTNFFPSIITDLPEADIPVEGLKSHLFQGTNRQIVFMSFEKEATVTEHSHKAQWGVVLDGEIEFTIGEDKLILSKGDTYFIPEGVKHSATIKKGYKDLNLFDQKDRYGTRE